MTVYHLHSIRRLRERKYVSNVLKTNGYTKTILRNRQKPVTTSSTPDEREPATGFAVIPYIQGVTESIKRILSSHHVKVAQKHFQTLGHHWSDHLKGPLVAAFRSPLMKALERSVETLGL